jgi:ACS family hexuronate transporter-like MFS transporter
MAEAATIPAGMKAIAEWFPDRERSIATGWFNAGTAAGAALAPVVVALIAKQWGWQAGFFVTGAIGLVWALRGGASIAAGAIARSHRPGTAPDRGRAARGGRGRCQVTIRAIIGAPRFWAIAVPRFLAEPAWQTFSFWIPLYLANERHMDLTQIAMFAWLPFLAADAGGIIGGYLAPLFQRRWGLSLEASRIAGICLGAVLMIGPGLVGLVAHPLLAIALLSVGGFAHQMISVLINTLSADVFPAPMSPRPTAWSAWPGGRAGCCSRWRSGNWRTRSAMRRCSPASACST